MSRIRQVVLAAVATAVTIGLSGMVIAKPAVTSAASGAGAASGSASGSAPTIVASTPIIADLVRNVAPQAHIHTLVPPGADPHTYEPSMATLRDITHADIAFSNQLMLEERSLISTIDANLPDGAPHVALGEQAVQFGGYQIPLVENAALSTVWLGLRVDGRASDSTVSIAATDSRGPGEISAFTTGTFGQPTPWMASYDGFDEADVVELPTNAHTHMSWGFTQPGVYELDMTAAYNAKGADADGESRELGQATITFAVGVDPHALGKRVIDAGHFDITGHLDGGMTLYGDTPEGDQMTLDPQSVVIAVPHTTTTVVPDRSWEFLGDPGEEAWILAQAVLGRHVHGEVDPHLWHDVGNAIAYVEVIADEMAKVDPANANAYAANADTYIERLRTLDSWAGMVLGSIPRGQRTLVTAHDSFGYLARAYDLDIAGFVAPNPSLEPSVQQLTNLTRTLQSTPAAGVFLEPTSMKHVGELVSIAHDTGKYVCSIYSDTLDQHVTTYEQMVEYNVRSLKSCLDPAGLPAWDPAQHTAIPVVADGTGVSQGENE
ncbi:anchored repeat ABC transporter, substrate-binding protein [Trueperella bialowiezensis]|uniref:Saliva-binding protein n=1 Tax=Trueperella bialowiezensis TaxID=312285 RepID=A0A448PEF1_9ACTO|nr:anchored repeat ABC transporter, substrate-binding protein [Trueperella bialowiezensis]VEI13306.1 Saliva-binding protein [Trueperella bialowiezensis]